MTHDEFATLFGDYHSRLICTIRKRWQSDLDQAEDIASRTWCRAWSTRDAYDPSRSSASTWLYSLARTEAYNAKRSAKRSKVSIGDAGYDPSVPAALPEDTEVLQSILATVPDTLRPIAELLASETPKGIIARMLGVHRDTLHARCVELRQWAESHQIFPTFA